MEQDLANVQKKVEDLKSFAKELIDRLEAAEQMTLPKDIDLKEKKMDGPPT